MSTTSGGYEGPVGIRMDIPSLPADVGEWIERRASDELAALAAVDGIDDRLVEIVLTEDLARTVSEICADWNIEDRFVSREKGFTGHALTLSRTDPSEESIFVIDARLALVPPLLGQVLVGLATSLRLERSLPTRYNPTTTWYSTTPIAEVLPSFMGSWAIESATYAQLKSHGLIEEDTRAALPFIDWFMRQIKRAHLEYQSDRSDSNVDRLRVSVLSTIRKTVYWGIDAYYQGATFDGRGAIGEAIRDLAMKAIEAADTIFENEQPDETEIIDGIDSLLSLCFMTLDPSDEGKRRTGLTIMKNPKLVFKGVIIDTEPRFVAFLDILGFQEMIDEYDNNEESDRLRVLKESLENAILKATTRNKRLSTGKLSWGVDPFYDDFEELLHYRMFSDCFSLSLPYFDEKKDFLVQFASIMATVRIFVRLLMDEEILIRGGLANGSFYSDENILFSGALVKAYKIETCKPGMPRVVVDQSIVDRVKNGHPVLRLILGLPKSLVHDKVDGVVFINPLGQEHPVEMSASEILGSIEELYGELGVGGKEYDLLLMIAKLFRDLSPESLETPIRLTPPEDIAEGLGEKSVQDTIEWIQGTIESERAACKEGDKVACSIIEKYEWLLNFVLWWSGDTDDDRFEYVV